MCVSSGADRKTGDASRIQTGLPDITNYFQHQVCFLPQVRRRQNTPVLFWLLYQDYKEQPYHITLRTDTGELTTHPSLKSKYWAPGLKAWHTQAF